MMKDRGILATFLVSLLSEISNRENSSQFKLVKDPSSVKVADLLINKTIPVTLYNNLLTFRDTDKKSELQGDLLKMMTNKNYNVDLAHLSDKKFMYEFAQEMYFDEKVLGNTSTSAKSFIRVPKSPAVMAGYLEESNTSWLSSDPYKLCDRIKLLLQKKQAGKNSNLRNEEVVAKVNKLSEYKCISTK